MKEKKTRNIMPNEDGVPQDNRTGQKKCRKKTRRVSDLIDTWASSLYFILFLFISAVFIFVSEFSQLIELCECLISFRPFAVR